MSQTFSSALSKRRLQISAALCTSQLSLPLLTMIYSGAEDNFWNMSGILLEPLKTPLATNAFDGRFLDRATHHTLPVTLLSGNHREIIQLNVISAPKTPLDLGYP